MEWPKSDSLVRFARLADEDERKGAASSVVFHLIAETYHLPLAIKLESLSGCKLMAWSDDNHISRSV